MVKYTYYWPGEDKFQDSRVNYYLWMAGDRIWGFCLLCSYYSELQYLKILSWQWRPQEKWRQLAKFDHVKKKCITTIEKHGRSHWSQSWMCQPLLTTFLRTCSLYWKAVMTVAKCPPLLGPNKLGTKVPETLIIAVSLLFFFFQDTTKLLTHFTPGSTLL